MEPSEGLFTAIWKTLKRIFVQIFDTTETEKQKKTREFVHHLSVVLGNIFFLIFCVSFISLQIIQLSKTFFNKWNKIIFQGVFESLDIKSSVIIGLLVIIIFLGTLYVLLKVYKIINGLELTKLLILFTMVVFVINFIRMPLEKKEQFLQEQVFRFIKLEPLQTPIEKKLKPQIKELRPLNRKLPPR
jgi:hypothetical protein